MQSPLATVVLSTFCAFSLTACAVNTGDRGSVGSTAKASYAPRAKPKVASAVTKKPQAKPEKPVRIAGKNCRRIKRVLKTLEGAGATGTKAYDKAIEHYIKLDCDTSNG